MKITIILLFTSICAFAQKKEEPQKIKSDSIVLSDYQMRKLMELDNSIKEITAVLEQRKENQRLFLEGILSIKGDPDRLKWEFKAPNKIMIKP